MQSMIYKDGYAFVREDVVAFLIDTLGYSDDDLADIDNDDLLDGLSLEELEAYI